MGRGHGGGVLTRRDLQVPVLFRIRASGVLHRDRLRVRERMGHGERGLEGRGDGRRVLRWDALDERKVLLLYGR